MVRQATCCAFFTTVLMSSTWKNLCTYWKCPPKGKEGCWHILVVHHICLERERFFPLNSHKEICQQFYPVTDYCWDEYSFRGHFAGLATMCFCTLTCSSVPDDLQAELKLRLQTVKPTIRMTWTVMYISLLTSFGYLEIIYANAFLYAIS